MMAKPVSIKIIIITIIIITGAHYQESTACNSFYKPVQQHFHRPVYF